MSINSDDQLVSFLSAGLKLSITLEFGPNDTHSFTADYLGCKLDQFFLVEFPKKAQELLVMRQINNVSVVIRAVTQSKLGHIIAFKSSILSSITTPTGLLFIRIPTHFESKPIRRHERYPLDIPIQVVANAVTYEATMVNLSMTGCAIFIQGENLLEPSSVIEISSELCPVLPDNLNYSIVTIEKQKQGHQLGIQFNQQLKLTDSLKTTLLEKAFRATPL